MTSTQFKNEKLYLATMSIVKKMLVDELISLEEYRQIDTIPRYRTFCKAELILDNMEYVLNS